MSLRCLSSLGSDTWHLTYLVDHLLHRYTAVSHILAGLEGVGVGVDDGRGQVKFSHRPATAWPSLRATHTATARILLTKE